MRKFLSHFFHYIGVSIIFLMIMMLILQTTSLFESQTGTEQIIAISNTTEHAKIKSIWLGDSVGEQFFGTNDLDSSGTVSMCLNAALTTYGDFLLLNNYLKKNTANIDTATNVTLAITLKGLSSGLKTPQTFNYFIKPFYNDQFILKDNNAYVIKLLEDYKLKKLSQLKIVKQRPFFSENSSDPGDAKKLSNLNVLGIKKIEALCKQHHIKFSVLVLPLSSFWEKQLVDYKNDLNKVKLDALALGLSNFQLTDDKLFIFDHIHFKNKTQAISLMKTNHVQLINFNLSN